MKVCKFEKIKDEDEMKQVINCIQKEHPYVAVVPILAQLQEWLQAISISWFHEEDEASHATVNAIEAYCCTLANHLITDSHLNQEIKNRILECIKKIHILVEDKADLLIDKMIKAEVYGLSSDLFTYCLRQQGLRARHYKIFCVNGNTGFKFESRIFYFIHLQNEEDYERKESRSA